MLGGVMGLIALVVAIPVVVEALTPVFAKSAEQWVNLGSASSLKTTSRQAGSAGVGGWCARHTATSGPITGPNSRPPTTPTCGTSGESFSLASCRPCARTWGVNRQCQ